MTAFIYKEEKKNLCLVRLYWMENTETFRLIKLIVLREQGMNKNKRKIKK